MDRETKEFLNMMDKFVEVIDWVERIDRVELGFTDTYLTPATATRSLSVYFYDKYGMKLGIKKVKGLSQLFNTGVVKIPIQANFNFSSNENSNLLYYMNAACKYMSGLYGEESDDILVLKQD